MATIRLPQSYGSVVYVDGVCYSIAADQPSLGPPNKSIGTGDKINIQAQVFVTPDPVFGDTWSACQNCVATMPIHSGSVSAAPSNQTPTQLYEAIYGGVLRHYSGTSYRIFLNGIYIDQFSNASTTQSRPILLNAGDIVSATSIATTSSATVFFIFLPYVWPQPE